ncbi:MAG: sensor histidine kinase [Oscillospiraceae bacterium]|nr:sensor histidine kinase [Oscillospiraceae bacterium]
MKLKLKFFIAFFVISIIPIFVITAFTYTRYTNLVHEQTTRVAQNVFEKAVGEANTSINNISHISEIFTFYSGSHHSIINNLKLYSSKDSRFTAYDIYKSNENIKFICQNLIYSTDYINGIFLFTPSGVTLGYGYGNGIDIRDGYEPFHDEWYKKTVALHGANYIDGITTKDFILNAKSSISFSKSLYDIYSHKFLGILFIDCSPSVFDLSKVNTLPDTATLFIENESNGYILSSNANSSPDLNQNSCRKAMKKKLDIENLTLVCSVNYSKLYREFGVTQIMIIWIGLICGAVFFVISILLSHYLTRPIVYVSRKIANRSGHNMVTNGKYLKRTDEIGVLCNEYNNMLEELNQVIKQEYKSKLIALDSQMKSLEAQINSHFLYNTLESINSIAEIEEVNSIATMSLALGNMFRYSIKTKSELVLIQDELNHVHDYISIQKIRFDNRFVIQFDLPEEMLKMRVLKLILQPIVENALYHGLQYCNFGDTIVIRGYVDSSVIYLSVTDNGIGMKPEQIQKLQSSLMEEPHFTELGQRNSQSIGLKNIHARIALYYGKGYGLSIKSSEHSGTTVTIKLPVIQDEESGCNGPI